MNDKMAKNTNLSTIKFKKKIKQTRRTETESWIWKSFWWFSDGRGLLGTRWRCEGINGQKKGKDQCGELFQAWEMWLSPHLEKPVRSKVGRQDPRPWIGSPVGNQACTVPRLPWDLLLLKLPHPELRQQMFTKYFHLPKVCAKPPKYGVWATSLLSYNILLFEVTSSVLSFVLLKR